MFSVHATNATDGSALEMLIWRISQACKHIPEEVESDALSEDDRERWNTGFFYELVSLSFVSLIRRGSCE